MLALLLIVPLLLGMLASALVPNKMFVRYIALAASLISLAMFPFISYGETSLTWFAISGHSFDISTMVSPLNALLLLVVLVIAPLIFLYSSGFMDTYSEQQRFYIEMLGFDAAMLAFAMAGSFILLFIAWEFLSLTSYLLIGFWYSREKAVRAARKAITIIMIGDIALLASIVIFWNIFGTLDFATILTSLATYTSSPLLYIATILFMIAILTKSAQFPFQEWLPEAMEGPTPVSAFLHSTTMVKAGVFAVMILLPLFAITKVSKVILVLGIVTAVIATLDAMRETHIKKIIAYSTIQELSLMLIALGAGALYAAVYFFFAQSFYKALLFFSSGSIMRATGKEDINQVTGITTNKLLIITTLFGVISLAGFIPFDGFFANAGLGSALSGNIVIYAIISAISLGTSFYIFRWLFVMMKKPQSDKVKANYLYQPRSMTVSMIILAALTLIGSIGFFVIPNFITSSPYQNYAYSSYTGALSISAVDAILETILISVGLLASYYIYKKKTIAKNLQLGKLDLVIYTSKAFNSLYDSASFFIYELSEGIAIFDTYLSDAFDYLGYGIGKSGIIVRRASVGEINLYALIFAGGLLLLFIFLYISVFG